MIFEIACVAVTVIILAFSLDVWRVSRQLKKSQQRIDQQLDDLEQSAIQEFEIATREYQQALAKQNDQIIP